MGELLTASSQMTCPHGGIVIAIPTGPRASIGGAPVVLSTDIFQITGCHLLVSPCVAVRWIVPSQSSTGGGAAALTSDSVGTCMGASGGEQGTVLLTAAAQTRVAGL